MLCLFLVHERAGKDQYSPGRTRARTWITLDILGADLLPDDRAICHINASGQITIPSAILSQFDSPGYACFIDDEEAGVHLYPSDFSYRPDRDPRVDRVTVRPVDSAPIEVEPPSSASVHGHDSRW